MYLETPELESSAWIPRRFLPAVQEAPRSWTQMVAGKIHRMSCQPVITNIPHKRVMLIITRVLYTKTTAPGIDFHRNLDGWISRGLHEYTIVQIDGELTVQDRLSYRKNQIAPQIQLFINHLGRDLGRSG